MEEWQKTFYEFSANQAQREERIAAHRRKAHAYKAITNANNHVMMLIKQNQKAIYLHGLQLANGLQTTLQQLTGDTSIKVIFNTPPGY